MQSSNEIASERRIEVEKFANSIASSVNAANHSRDALRSIENALRDLASRDHLYPEAHFPRQSDAPGALYELWVNEAGTAALYFNVIWDDIVSPPHRHGTWAVIAGMMGAEPNQTYRLNPETDAPVALERIDVVPGVVVSMLPTDVHSIHVHSPFPVKTLHLYGRSLATAGLRELYNTDQKEWQTYPAQVEVLQPVST
jgi:predicted metal-dependent enzyme (double-stranded beta helix superfamily)